jgi:RecA-family ATPase
MVELVTPLRPPDAEYLAHRTPPHSIEAEQSVIGGLLLNNAALSKVSDILRPENFYRRDHRAIYAAVVRIIEAGQPADALTLAEALEQAGILAKVGGQSYIGSLALNTPSAANIRRYAEIVAERALRRDLIALANTVQDQAHNGADVAEIIARTRNELAALPVTAREQPFRPVWLDDAETPTQTEYLIKGLIDRGGLTVIYGPSGDGKTFFTADLAAHIACGLQWRGRRVRPALVVYVAAEAGASILRRFCAWRDKHRGDGPAERTPLAILTRGANLLDLADVTALIASLRTLADQAGLPVGLVVFDTLSRSMPGGDENGPESMTQVVGATDRIRDELGAACAIVHHSGKDKERGARGHSSLIGAADTVLQVVDRVATIEKARDGMAGDKFAFDLEVVKLGEDPDGDPISTCVVVPTDATALPVRQKSMPYVATIALHALREALSENGQLLPGTSTIPAGIRGVTIQEWRGQFRVRHGTDGDEARDREALKKAFQRGRAYLINAKIAGLSDPYAWLW